MGRVAERFRRRAAYKRFVDDARTSLRLIWRVIVNSPGAFPESDIDGSDFWWVESRDKWREWQEMCEADQTAFRYRIARCHIKSHRLYNYVRQQIKTWFPEHDGTAP